MLDSISGFAALSTITVLDALKKIDINGKGFLVLVDNSCRVQGVITDGDIRRAFIKGASVNDRVTDYYTRSFKSLKISDGLYDAIEFFKKESINFLPIVSDEGKLLNIITKRQMHSLLLQDIKADLLFDFTKLDDSIVEHEIFQRPWGFYKTTVKNDYFQSKIICVNPKQQLSLQSHEHREEYWVVAHGEGTIQIDDSVKKVTSGSSLFIPKGCKHRLINESETQSLIVTEVQIGDYFGEDDIIRYDDIYGRK